MSALAQYILNVSCAALLCAIMKSLPTQKGTSTAIATMLCGIFLMFTMLSPVKDIELADFGKWSDAYIEEGKQIAAIGSDMQKSWIESSIRQETEAYILDKADALQTQLVVEVTLSDDDIPHPVKVRLSGNISPYAKSQLQRILEDDLGIAKENQIWT